MALTKAQKQKIIEDLKEKITKQKAIIFIDFTGLKVKDFSGLRKRLKMADCQLKVAKKTLIGLAFKAEKIEIETKKLPGEVALVFGYKDPISPAKIVYQFAETNSNLKVLAGFFENKFRELEEIINLAQLPSREKLLVRLIENIQAPVSNFIRILEANIKGLIYVLAKAKT